MKDKLKRILQFVLGLRNYNYFLGIYKVYASKNNEYEKDFPFFLSQLKEDFCVLDIGANVGYTTVLIAKKVKKGQVYSFEPVQYNFEALKRIVKKFKLTNVTLFKCAVADKVGTIEMSIPVVKSVKNTNNSHIVDDSHSIENGSLKVSAKLITLDSIDELKDKKIDAVKIDVEGFENLVFKGGETLIRKNKPIIYSELTGEENKKRSIDFFNALRYKIKVYENNGLIDYNSLVHNPQNYFFIPD
jgi:FkbM family methyltransferase